MKKLIYIIPILLLLISCSTTKTTTEQIVSDSRVLSKVVQEGIDARDSAMRSEGVDFLSIGSNPDWLLKISNENQTLSLSISGEQTVEWSLSELDHIDYNDLHVINGGDEISITSTEAQIADPRTGEIFPYKVTVVLNDRQFVGYGKELKVAEITVPMQLHDIWALEAVDGKKLEFSDKTIYRPTLEINLKKMTAMGLTGCNNFQADMIIDGDQLSFPPFPMTQMFCEGYENVFVKGITNTASYKLNGMNLYFYDKDGKEVLRFKKVD